MPFDEIEVIKQKLVDQIKPIGVYLFGSFANGTAHADSDFDFYIIVDDRSHFCIQSDSRREAAPCGYSGWHKKPL